ncbi:MAG: hypothetical protein AB8H03_23440 [Saprospiraceae bacterium]
MINYFPELALVESNIRKYLKIFSVASNAIQLFSFINELEPDEK